MDSQTAKVINLLEQKITPTTTEFINQWKQDFTDRVKFETKSKKAIFTFYDACCKPESYRNDFDKAILTYLSHVKNCENSIDYLKYMNSYINGKKLNNKYFKHDISKLESYYLKHDKSDLKTSPFDLQNYKDYVLYSTLVFTGQYDSDYDDMFVFGKIPSVLIAEIPFNICKVIEPLKSDVLHTKINDSIYILKEHSKGLKTEQIQRPTIENNLRLFYDIQGNKVITSNVSYNRFFEQENFIRVTQQDKDVITIFKDTNKIIKPFNIKTDLTAYLRNEINEFDTEEIENTIANDNYNAIQKGLLLLQPKELKYYSDCKNTFAIPFKNGLFRYDKTTKEISKINYSDVDGFFAEHFTQGIEFEYNDTEISQFETYLTIASTGKDSDLTKVELSKAKEFFKMFGYMIHQYKDPAFTKAIVLSDIGANNEDRNGRRGKSLLLDAISKVRKSLFKGGDDFDADYTFVWDDLKKDIDTYQIDDVPASFNYNALYTPITNNINCARKGTKAEEINKKDTPKFIITTNWSFRVDKNNSSTQGRFIEYQFTDFFNNNRTIRDYFGCTFFDDWDSKEWNLFYSFAFKCVAFFLEDGLVQVEYDKTLDNFNANFNNDAMLAEMNRIISTFLEREEFSVTEFLEAYNNPNNHLAKAKLYHQNNAKKLINIYIDYKGLPFKYSQMNRVWINNSKKESDVTF
jgi:hypothetical protein